MTDDDPARKASKGSEARANLAAFERAKISSDVDRISKRSSRLTLTNEAKLELRSHAIRAKYLPDAMLSDCQWQILLSLYVGDREARFVSFAELRANTSLSAMSAARLIDVLSGMGLVARPQLTDFEGHPIISITKLGRDTVVKLLEELSRQRSLL